MEWLYAPLQSINEILFGATDNLEWWQVALVLADYSLKIVALGWVPADRRPSSAMAWLLSIFLVPFVGIALFFLMGSPYVNLSLIHISEPTRPCGTSRMPSSA